MTEQSGEQQPDPKEAPKEQPKGDEAKFTQAQLNSFLANQKRDIESKYDGFDDIKAKAVEFEKLTESTKTEVQRATEAAQAAAGERDTFKSENEKLRSQLQRQLISATQGLDPELWDRVQGSTVEEIEADVKKLVEKFSVTPKRAGALRSGASVPEGASGKRGAAALRGLRRD